MWNTFCCMINRAGAMRRHLHTEHSPKRHHSICILKSHGITIYLNKITKIDKASLYWTSFSRRLTCTYLPAPCVHRQIFSRQTELTMEWQQGIITSMISSSVGSVRHGIRYSNSVQHDSRLHGEAVCSSLLSQAYTCITQIHIIHATMKHKDVKIHHSNETHKSYMCFIYLLGPH